MLAQYWLSAARHDTMPLGTLRPWPDAAPTRPGIVWCEKSNPSLRAPLRRSLLLNLSASEPESQ
jgi:hypothetical protein